MQGGRGRVGYFICSMFIFIPRSNTLGIKVEAFLVLLSLYTLKYAFSGKHAFNRRGLYIYIYIYRWGRLLLTHGESREDVSLAKPRNSFV